MSIRSCSIPLAYDLQANGAAEKAVHEFMRSIRVLELGLEQRSGRQIETEEPTMEWIVEHVSMLIDECVVGHDGKTAHRMLWGDDSSKPLVE